MLSNGHRKILLVEDSVRVRPLITQILKGAGFEVLVTENADQALAAVRECGGELNLIITDVMLPDSSGFELARRAGEICPGIRILYMSGFDLQLPPGTPFIDKPFRSEHLIESVNKVLGS